MWSRHSKREWASKLSKTQKSLLGKVRQRQAVLQVSLNRSNVMLALTFMLHLFSHLKYIGNVFLKISFKCIKYKISCSTTAKATLAWAKDLKDISLKKIHKWPVSAWKDIPHQSWGICKSKSWHITSHPIGWLLLKKIAKKKSVGGEVDKLEPCTLKFPQKI